MSASAPCVLCDGRWPSSGTEQYHDPLGFEYDVCAFHARRLLEGLRRIARRRLTKALTSRAWTTPSSRKKRGG